jgi:transcriptional regulator with XRE-family HTH domain
MYRYANKLRRLRVQKGFSQEYMAQELDLSTSGYRKLESGESKLKIETVLKLSKVLDIELVDFLAMDDERINIQKDNRNCNNVQGAYFAGDGEVKALRELLDAKDEIIALLRKRLNE